jgi:NADH:ubiquinone oxidoreductase subunit K
MVEVSTASSIGVLVGLTGAVMLYKNPIRVLMSLEVLMLGIVMMLVVLSLVANSGVGSSFGFIVMLVGAAETVLGLTLVIKLSTEQST